MASFTPRYGTVDRDYGIRLATTPPAEDGPVWMLNLMKYRAVASYSDGNPSGITGKEADDRYAPTKILRTIGADVPFFGEVDEQLTGSDVRWDRIGMVKYPTRRSFVDMQRRPDFMEKHEHKEAGMEFTFVMGCQPVDLAALPGHGGASGSDDQGIVLLHVLSFDDSASDEVRSENLRSAHESAVSSGGRPLTWFEVEGTIMGDGRRWDAARFTRYASVDAFAHVHDDAVSDEYVMVVRPTINDL